MPDLNLANWNPSRIRTALKGAGSGHYRSMNKHYSDYFRDHPELAGEREFYAASIEAALPQGFGHLGKYLPPGTEHEGALSGQSSQTLALGVLGSVAEEDPSLLIEPYGPLPAVRRSDYTDRPGMAVPGSLLIGRANTKATARRTRTIHVPDVTARELKAWRLQAGRPDDGEPIAGPMTANALKLWGARRLRRAIEVATAGRIGDATVYTLRHSHASALHYAAFTVPEAARRMGHGAELHLRTYAHVIESISGERYRDLDALIAAARADLVFRQSSAEPSRGG